MILLTGGAGFIGSNILAELDAADHTDVVIVDRLGSGPKWRNIAQHRFADLIAPDEVERYLMGRPDISAVIHMGANSSTTAIDGDALLRTNLRASMRLWDWCACARRPFVYASSAAPCGDGVAGFDDQEDEAYLSQLRPLNVYVKDCAAVTLWLLGNGTASGLFNLGTGQARSFRDLILALGSALGRDAAIDYVDMPPAIRGHYQYFTQAAMAKLRNAGYAAPFHSVEAGARDYVRGYLAQPDPHR